jgi:hypothetical protein
LSKLKRKRKKLAEGPGLEPGHEYDPVTD